MEMLKHLKTGVKAENIAAVNEKCTASLGNQDDIGRTDYAEYFKNSITSQTTGALQN
ncbi:hypothetical protein J2Z42_000450 [Clostridium algifaecis]|uniref:Uncharacterized protein n=1 Tax=Clostridium algifaecis TaxID=1472040 RepID=A0ABS4KP18_9CLOT|nr:hypothetical protein [Clostridium algifaecis]MBP2031785.1 hypothetical protein [Clostridium algifaecis]